MGIGAYFLLLIVSVALALENITVGLHDDIVSYSSGWVDGGRCGFQACILNDTTPIRSISFNFTGVAIYYQGGPIQGIINGVVANISLDGEVVTVDLSGSSHPESLPLDVCEYFPYAQQDLENKLHTVDVKFIGPSSGAMPPVCASLTNFIYTIQNDTSKTTSFSSPSSTSSSVTSSSTSTTTSTRSTPSAPPSSPPNRKINVALVVGVSGGIVIVLIVVCLLVYLGRYYVLRKYAPSNPQTNIFYYIFQTLRNTIRGDAFVNMDNSTTNNLNSFNRQTNINSNNDNSTNFSITE